MLRSRQCLASSDTVVPAEWGTLHQNKASSNLDASGYLVEHLGERVCRILDRGTNVSIVYTVVSKSHAFVSKSRA